jgi:hypothetical protein
MLALADHKPGAHEHKAQLQGEGRHSEYAVKP